MEKGKKVIRKVVGRICKAVEMMRKKNRPSKVGDEKKDAVSRSTILAYVVLRIFFSGLMRIVNT